jgi:hypothetical protein
LRENTAEWARKKIKNKRYGKFGESDEGIKVRKSMLKHYNSTNEKGRS